jgi:hypothetical protein
MLYFSELFRRYDLVELPLSLGLAQTVPPFLLVGVATSFFSTFWHVERPVAFTIATVTGFALAAIPLLGIALPAITYTVSALYGCIVGYPLGVIVGRSLGHAIENRLVDVRRPNPRWQNFSIRTVSLLTIAFACLAYLFFAPRESASILLWSSYFCAWAAAVASYCFDACRDRRSVLLGGIVGVLLAGLFSIWFWRLV